jgi:transcriptional regulator with XRE-family HTH domain
MKLGECIKRRRLARGMTQQQLSEATGCCLSTVSQVESGKSYPSAELLLLLATALDCSVDKLVKGWSEPNE